MNGILIVNKDPGMTSHDVVYALRRLTGIKKIGHTGTLDPIARGVLPMCIGKATRLASYIQTDRKTYRAQAILGKRTDSFDKTGQVIGEKAYTGSKEDLEALLKTYIGPQMQEPPMYSAVKVQGKKLYEYAREGLEVKRKARPIEIYDLFLMDYDQGTFSFEVTCSSGTYVRSLIDQIGLDLGTYAYMEELQRTQVGAFSLKEAHRIEDLKALDRDQIEDYLLPMERALVSLDRLDLEEGLEDWIKDGKAIPYPGLLPDKEYAVYSGGQFMGIGKMKARGSVDQLHVHKVLL
ncbi:MAG: tRNA pseudouridine(55) synthase TruB [Tissierellia bacterium]|nr:tRNA pseudouridine(55) synthase TruB [Tissierellia bacterium]